MNTTDKISKDLLVLTSFIKDSTKKNVTEAFQKGQLTCKEEELRNLLFIIESTIDNSMQKAIPTFQKSVNNHLTSLKEDFSFQTTKK